MQQIFQNNFFVIIKTFFDYYIIQLYCYDAIQANRKYTHTYIHAHYRDPFEAIKSSKADLLQTCDAFDNLNNKLILLI